MNLHEHQAKTLLRPHGVRVPPHRAVLRPGEALRAAQQLLDETGAARFVVKAQIHAGGRGKGRFMEDPELGGVKLVESTAEVSSVAERMLGRTLVTLQTGPAGRVVNRILIEPVLPIARELYVAAVLDRVQQRICVMACAEGGVEIEEVAARAPEKILREWVDPVIGLSAYQARRLAYGLGLQDRAAKGAAEAFVGVARAFEQEDCTLLEINPLVITQTNDVVALDAKVTLDDSAAYRHPGWPDFLDSAEEDPSELSAQAANLAYVKLDGAIGCMVNGAGLAMATMDIIRAFGGSPANFLDVGGGASKERVVLALKIILADVNVRGIFVNIFGGIVHCDLVAQGIVDAVREVGLAVPLVVRLEGTNVEAGRRILAEAGLHLTTASDMADGARQAVALTRRADDPPPGASQAPLASGAQPAEKRPGR
ncbi:MAG: ADP-forming succinate--CoA ligase subunit beta [Proteobacteria bacterium]|nr:ADP-forming succinate--CoA ligase subunit beta [Pseudomonadota bacterium]